jgi:hypothetical protein
VKSQDTFEEIKLSKERSLNFTFIEKNKNQAILCMLHSPEVKSVKEDHTHYCEAQSSHFLSCLLLKQEGKVTFFYKRPPEHPIELPTT